MTKPKLILMLILGLFTIDGDQEIFDGFGHHNHFYSGAGHAQIVSINYGTDPNQYS